MKRTTLLLGIGLAMAAADGVWGQATSEVTITNASFELPVAGGGNFEYSIPGWTLGDGTQGGVFNPGSSHFNEGLPDGQQVAWMNTGGSISQVLGESLEPNHTYALSVAVGVRKDMLSTTNYAVELLAGSQVLGMANPTLSQGGFVTATVNYATKPGDVAIGQPLEIRLSKAATVYGEQLNFDKVILEKAPVNQPNPPIANGSFESPALSLGQYEFGVTGWQTSPGTQSGVQHLTTASFPETAADGNQVSFLNTSGWISQTLDTQVQAGNAYTLSVAVGARLDTFTSDDYAVQLLAGGQLLGAANPAPVKGGFVTATVTYTAKPDDAVLGQPLEIRLMKGATVYGDQVCFDHVVLQRTTIETSVAPAITTQPVGQVVVVGATASFHVVATGTPPLTYQWQLNGTNLPNSTDHTLSLTNVTLTDAGEYRVVVSNSAGSMPSDAALLQVGVPPRVDLQPINQVGRLGESVTFTANAAGTEPLSYQWFMDGMGIEGAAGATLVLTNVQPSAQGNYTVLVSNLFGSVISTPGTLMVETNSPGSFIVNGSFEDPALGLGQYSKGVPGWVISPGSEGGVQNLGITHFTQAIPDGHQVAWLNLQGALSQQLTTTLKPNTAYTLSVAVGERLDMTATTNYAVQLLAGGQVLGSANPVPVKGGFVTATVTYLAQPGDPWLGQPLEIRLGKGETVYGDQICFDKVVLQEVPVVTADLSVANPSFEEPQLGLGQYSKGVPGWVISPGSEGGVQNLGITHFTQAIPDGHQVAWLNLQGALSQQLTATLEPNATYTLSVAAGDRLDMTATTNYAVQLLAGGHVLGSANPVPVKGGFVTATVTYLAQPGDPWLGQPLEIRLAKGASIYGDQICFDKVNLQVRQFPGAPVIISQPAGAILAVGGNVSFKVLAAGTPAPAYQWLFHGSNLADATSDTLSLTNVTMESAGEYRVRVSNQFGSVLSEIALLQVGTAPSVNLQPARQIGYVGQSVTFNANAGGSEPLAYQWYKDGLVIQGATAAALQLTNLQLTAQGEYSVLVSNPFGSITSGLGKLIVELKNVSMIEIANGSFESPALGLGQFSVGVPGWNVSEQSEAGVQYLGGTSFSGNMPDGHQVAWVNRQGWLWQQLTNTLQADASYTLSVAVGARLDMMVTTNYAVQLVAAGQILGSANPTLVKGGFVTATVTYVANAGDPVIGQPLEIRLAKGATVYGEQVCFDKVQLEVTPSSTSACPALPANLVAWWPLDGHGMNLVGTNNTATVVGHPPFVPGMVDEAVQLGQPGAYLKVPASPQIDLGGLGLTMELWINPSTVEFQQPLLEWNNGKGSIGTLFWIAVQIEGGGPGSLFASIIDTDGMSHAISSSPGLLQTNTFQHVAVTYATNGICRLFLNGRVVKEQNLGLWRPQTTYDLIFGLRPSGTAAGNRFYGLMDEVALYTRPLDPVEIQNHYLVGGPSRCKPPVVTEAPKNQLTVAGRTVSFEAQAVGAAPLAFLWFKDGVAIPDATNATLTLPLVRLADAGNYTVTVTNPNGSSTRGFVLAVSAAEVALDLYPGLMVEGEPGKTYEIQYTTDLGQPNQWLGLTNLLLTTPKQFWLDMQPARLEKRFYRAVLAPAATP